MRYSTSIYLVLASALGMVALIVFQVAWLRQSQTLVEEQFQSKVNTALSSTVACLASDASSQATFQEVCVPTAEACREKLEELIQTDRFAQVLSKSLAGHDINLPYEAKVCAKEESGSPVASTAPVLPPYSFALDPITQTDDHFLNLEFAGRKRYILDQMGIMTAASVGILTLICLLFFYATYRLLKEQKMSNLNREFFNHMAHEFRTPLTNIKLAGSLLQRKELVPAGRPHLDIIQDEASQLMRQVEQVLYLARVEKDDYLLRKDDHDLVDLCRKTLATMQLQADKTNARLTFTPTHTSSVVSVDGLHLQNALRNLLDNALKYGGEHAAVRVDLREYAERVELAVIDNGPGLTERQQSQIFTPFYRLQTAPRQCKGFGLGLAYVKRIVELHQGRVTLTSTPGQGATFTITLPKT